MHTWRRAGAVLIGLAVGVTSCSTAPTTQVLHPGIPCEAAASFRPVVPKSAATAPAHRLAAGMTARLVIRHPVLPFSGAYLELVRRNTKPGGPRIVLARSPIIRPPGGGSHMVTVTAPRGLADGHYPVFGVVRGLEFCGQPHLAGPTTAVNKIGTIAVIHG